MKIGVIADDFTGASDIALTLAEGGMAVTQFIGLPDGPAKPDVDAGVVALKSRTAPVAMAVARSLAACDWLLDQGAGQIVFKVCSTFDSTPAGNIGPVLDALAERLGAGPVIVCPAFPENGRSVYLGHLFVGDMLLSQSGMKHHPLTPMTDSDLRRVLAAQSRLPVRHIAAGVVFGGSEAIRAALPDHGHVIVDAIRDADLHAIGAAASALPLLCGGSGIALGLPATHGCVARTPAWQPIKGPGVVLSGSCSTATRAQVARFCSQHPAREVTAVGALERRDTATALADWVCAQDGPALVYSSADPEQVRDAQTRFGQNRVAHGIEALFSDLAVELARRGIVRMVVAGGETSGAVVNGLGPKELVIGPRLAAGVPATRVDLGHPVALALKSGNFGGENFFSEALVQMEIAR